MSTTTDIRQRFLFPDTDIRGEILRLEAGLPPALRNEHLALPARDLLGQAMAAVALLSGTLKFDGRLSLQARGDGTVQLLVAEATQDGGLRGMVRHNEEMTGGLDSLSPGDLLGGGTLAITLQPDQGHAYQGVVPLEQPDLAGCLQDYFRRSEQLPTHIQLACGHDRAAGLLLQRLPDRVASAEANVEAWQHLRTLASTLTAEELVDLPPEKVLHRLFHETPPEVTPGTPLRFACTCSRERVRNTLVSLGRDELAAILAEQGRADVTCEFCGTVEAFEREELRTLMEEAGS